MSDKSDNTGGGWMHDMSFKMNDDFHYRFKLEAHNSGISMTELLKRCFRHWLASKPN
jgi:hypothetical protein